MGATCVLPSVATLTGRSVYILEIKNVYAFTIYNFAILIVMYYQLIISQICD